MTNLYTQIDSHCIHGGHLYKKGVYNKAWRKRYFVLFDDRTISYFEKEKHAKSRNKAKGSIHLTQIQRVELVHYSDPNDDNRGNHKSSIAINGKNKYNKRGLRQSSKQNNIVQREKLKLQRQHSLPSKTYSNH